MKVAIKKYVLPLSILLLCISNYLNANSREPISFHSASCSTDKFSALQFVTGSGPHMPAVRISPHVKHDVFKVLSEENENESGRYSFLKKQSQAAPGFSVFHAQLWAFLHDLTGLGTWLSDQILPAQNNRFLLLRNLRI